MTTLQTQYDASDVLHALEQAIEEYGSAYNFDPLYAMNSAILRDLRDAAKREAGR